MSPITTSSSPAATAPSSSAVIDWIRSRRCAISGTSQKPITDFEV